MLTTLIAIRHDQDWAGAGMVLLVALIFTIAALVDRWIAGGGDLLDDLLERGYDDRIQNPYPPKPAGGNR